jgi:hypothetical protein
MSDIFLVDNTREYLKDLTENQLIESVIIPLYIRNSFKLVLKPTHGPGEHGKDIIFSGLDKFESPKMIYHAIQAKVVKIDVNNIDGIVNQAKVAYNVPFEDPTTGASTRIHYVDVITNREVTQDARKRFIFGVPENRYICIIDGEQLLARICQTRDKLEKNKAFNELITRFSPQMTRYPTVNNIEDINNTILDCLNELTRNTNDYAKNINDIVSDMMSLANEIMEAVTSMKQIEDPNLGMIKILSEFRSNEQWYSERMLSIIPKLSNAIREYKGIIVPFIKQIEIITDEDKCVAEHFGKLVNNLIEAIDENLNGMNELQEQRKGLIKYLIEAKAAFTVKSVFNDSIQAIYKNNAIAEDYKSHIIMHFNTQKEVLSILQKKISN